MDSPYTISEWEALLRQLRAAESSTASLGLMKIAVDWLVQDHIFAMEDDERARRRK